MRLVPLAVALMLGGCVNIIRVCGPDPVVVTNHTLGLAVAPHTVALGLTATKVVAIPASGCGVAIIENTNPSSGPFWRHIADRTRARCLNAKD